jgi:di/tripeptidase
MKTLFTDKFLIIVGLVSVKELQQMAIAAGGTGAVLPVTTDDMALQPENQQRLMQLVQEAMKKVQPVVGDK